MVDALTWLLTLELLGVIALPLCFVLFRRLPDRGITLAKPLALALLAYVLWIAGLTRLIPNTQGTIVAIATAAAVMSTLVFRGTAKEIWGFLREEWRTVIASEALFLAFFFLWLWITSEAPAIRGTEKPMDFGFMNAVLQSRHFPPEDPWLSGHSISYYYYGHFIMALLVKLTAIPSSVGYNLAVSLIPALAATGAFGLLYNLVRLSGGSRKAGIGFGLVAPALILLLGNLEGALEFVNARGWGGAGFWSWVGIAGLEAGPAGSGAFPDAPNWWWQATRVIGSFENGQQLDYTITEFPMFSFLLGDLHAHMLSLPFLLLALAVVLNLLRSEEPLEIGWLWRHPVQAMAVSLLIGSLGFINFWDLPLLAALLGVAALIRCYRDIRRNLQQAALRAAGLVLPILALAAILFLPFYLDLEGQIDGVLPLRDVSTRPFLFFVTMGLLAVLGVSFLVRQLPGLRLPTRDDAPLAGVILAAAAAPFVVWAVIVLALHIPRDGVWTALGDVALRGVWVAPGLAIAGLATYSATQRIRWDRETAAAFPLLLVAAAFYLLAGAELFYVSDAFGGAFRRMNTVFKVYYQAWLLLGVAGVYGLYYWGFKRRPVQGSGGGAPACARTLYGLGHYVWAAAAAVLLVASAYYPVGAVLDRTGVLEQSSRSSENTLDGLAFIRERYPGEYAAIEWLRDEAPWGRIVEAVGSSYSDFGRISSTTGLPTVLGWEGHEHQWRGGSAAFAGRAQDVERIYRSSDVQEVRRLLEGYHVRYVYVGERERATYGAEHLSGFGDFLKASFETDGVVVYEFMTGDG